METAGHGNNHHHHSGISDVELLEFLVGYNGHGGNCGQELHQPWRTDHGQHQHPQHHPQHHPPTPSPSVTPDRSEPCPKRRRTSLGSSGGLGVERWEPGEIVVDGEDDEDEGEEERSVSSGTSASSSETATRNDIYIVPHSTGSPPKKRGPRPKVLTPQEKRQKRLDANDRERERMGKLNLAFDSLRHLLPKHGNDRELSKFETIQIAKNYIRSLNDMLLEADNCFGGDAKSEEHSSFYLS